MVPESNGALFFVYQAKEAKKDLRTRFGDLLEEFKRENINGSIQLHFNNGFLAKIQSTKFE